MKHTTLSYLFSEWLRKQRQQKNNAIIRKWISCLMLKKKTDAERSIGFWEVLRKLFDNEKILSGTRLIFQYIYLKRITFNLTNKNCTGPNQNLWLHRKLPMIPISTLQVIPHLPWKYLQRLGPFPSLTGQLISAILRQNASWEFTPLT